MTSVPTNQSILLDIYQRLGTVETQNAQILTEQGRVRSDAAAISQNVAEVAQEIALTAQRVDQMEPHVTKMAAFRAQLALAVLFVTAVITGAINLVVYAVMHFSEIKTAFRELLR